MKGVHLIWLKNQHNRDWFSRYPEEYADGVHRDGREPDQLGG